MLFEVSLCFYFLACHKFLEPNRHFNLKYSPIFVISMFMFQMFVISMFVAVVSVQVSH